METKDEREIKERPAFFLQRTGLYLERIVRLSNSIPPPTMLIDGVAFVLVGYKMKSHKARGVISMPVYHELNAT